MTENRNNWWLYIDESGDLGFDFVNKSPSKHFTVCILATSSHASNISFKHAVKRTLRRKLNPKGKRSRMVEELKGAHTELPIKQYLWRLIESESFGIYCLTLNKRRVYEDLATNKNRTYNYISRLVVDQIPFERAKGNVHLIIDKSKGSREISEFNTYIRQSLEGRIDPELTLSFTHEDSRKAAGLQLADLFAWGIFQKYERKNTDWFDTFKQHLRYDELYLK